MITYTMIINYYDYLYVFYMLDIGQTSIEQIGQPGICT